MVSEVEMTETSWADKKEVELWEDVMIENN
jgi:hypothetical protein